MPGSGKITTEYTVWCAKCERWDQTGEHRNKAIFGSDLKLYGWRFTRAWGWVCPDHNPEYWEILERGHEPTTDAG